MARLNRRGYLVLIAGLAAQRLLEVGRSRRNVRRSGPGRRAAAGTFPAMVAVNVALFAVPAATRYRRPAPPRTLQALCLTGLVCATGLRVWVIRTLGDSWNVEAHVPQTLTPVTGGPYRWIRHPNYLAVLLEFACLPLLGGGYVEATVLSATNAMVLLPRIRDEEAILDTVPGYREAFADRPRFVPRIARLAGGFQRPASVIKSRGVNREKPW